jgi:hypothetical protein
MRSKEIAGAYVDAILLFAALVHTKIGWATARAHSPAGEEPDYPCRGSVSGRLGQNRAEENL